MTCLRGPSKACAHLARAFTLVEVVVSISVLSIIMLATGSVVVVAMRALPDPERPAYRVNQSSQIADQMIAELQESRHIIERTSTAVTFTVADRDGDGSPERIRYAWSETAGDPLTRQYNFGTEVTVLADVNQFNLAYDLQSDVEQYPGAPVYGSEILLNSYTAAKDLKEYKVKKNDWIGQYFQPPGGLFPADAVYWRVTRVKLEARDGGGQNEDTYVQLRPPDTDHKPTDTVIEQQVMDEGDLTDSWVWQEFSFSGAHYLEPGADLCLVLEGTHGTSAEVRWEDDNEYGATGRLKTNNGGNSWEYKTDKCMRYEIYGKVATPGPDQTATRQYITGVQLTLQSGTDAGTRIDTAVHLPNAPEVLSAVWELDFDTDPTALDSNGDGLSDWGEYSGPFDPATLINGLWYAPDHGVEGISTVPAEDFAELTTVELRYRATSVGGWGTVFWINADRRGGTSANLVADLYKPDASSQELWFGWELQSGAEHWVAVHDVPDALVNVRLLIDPAQETVALFVDDTHKGTYTYFRGNSDPDAMAWVYTQNCSGEFDHVSIRVGGDN